MMIQPGASESQIPVTAEVLHEAEALSSDILRDIELTGIPLSVVVLKALRLARILNDFDMQQIFEWESGGYPRNASGVSRGGWEAGEKAGRAFFKRDPESETPQQRVYIESIEEMEHTVTIGSDSLQAAHDPDVSISSANQMQRIQMPRGNASERENIRNRTHIAVMRLSSRRTFIYNYAVRKYYELKFSGLVDDVFGRIRASVDADIGILVPDAVKKFAAVYDNLRSSNPEDWANAVHSCRRVLQDLADAVFPPQAVPRTRIKDGKEVHIKLGSDHYINRLVAYVDDSSASARFTEIVGSYLKYIGDRLDALFGAVQKGSHSTVTKEEADRCVVYTYLLVGDILKLRALPSSAPEFDLDDEDSGAQQEAMRIVPADSLGLQLSGNC